MFVSKVLSVLISLLHVTLTESNFPEFLGRKVIEECNITQAINRTQHLLFASADVILIGQTGTISKSYGEGNQTFDISVTPHCFLKGNASEDDITVRKLGLRKCGPLNVMQNDSASYLFFLLTTSDDPLVYDVLNFGAKKLDGNYIFDQEFQYICGLRNEKVCGSSCVSYCRNFTPAQEGSCTKVKLDLKDLHPYFVNLKVTLNLTPILEKYDGMMKMVSPSSKTSIDPDIKSKLKNSSGVPFPINIVIIVVLVFATIRVLNLY